MARNLAIAALMVVVAVAGVLVGRLWRPAADSASAERTPPAVSALSVPQVASGSERSRSAAAPSQRRQTYRGPDGMTRLINYGDRADPAGDNKNRQIVLDALLADLRHHPDAVMGAYQLSAEQVEAMVAGSGAMPASVAVSLPDARPEPPGAD